MFLSLQSHLATLYTFASTQQGLKKYSQIVEVVVFIKASQNRYEIRFNSLTEVYGLRIRFIFFSRPLRHPKATRFLVLLILFFFFVRHPGAKKNAKLLTNFHRRCGFKALVPLLSRYHEYALVQSKDKFDSYQHALRDS